MKVVTILGTRPEIVRLSLILPKLDSLCTHKIIYTGQNYDDNLSAIFFRALHIRRPDYTLVTTAESVFEQIAKILKGCEEILLKEKPNRVLVLGDTNSALSAIVAKRLGIPVYHMEAGNRCNDDKVPEEINRRIIDHTSDILLPYTHRSKENLVKEGIPSKRIFVTGNPIYEVLFHFETEIEKSVILKRLRLKEKKYFLVTLHREENVDNINRLGNFVTAFAHLSSQYKIPVVWSVHPRTRKQLSSSKIKLSSRLQLHEPFSLFDFVKLEKNAFCVLTDSGTVQEECCIYRIPAVTLRDTTERPETIESGSNMLSGSDPDSIVQSVKTVYKQKTSWSIPEEYTRAQVSSTVVKILLSYNHNFIESESI